MITTLDGQLRVYQNGSLLATPALDLSDRICRNSERGLLGATVDPDFTNNNFIYLYYTFNKFGVCPISEPTNPNNPVNRVARFVLSGDNIVDPSSEVILIDNIQSPTGAHNAGDMQFGKDGFLYISVGDAGVGHSRTKEYLLGKILRITRDGLIPPTNPFQGPDSGRCNVTGITTPGNWCQETFAFGLRNPFRIAFDPNAAETRFFINDVGQATWEEINEGIPGADYGWFIREGPCVLDSTTDCGPPPAGMTNPIFAYQHTSDCNTSGVIGNSITGGAFVPRGIWPSQYEDAYLFGEWSCGGIFQLSPDGSGGFTASEFATGLGGGSVTAMIFGPHQDTQSLYYASFLDGQVRRISFVGDANRSPVAAVTATPTFGQAPLDVQFDASGSSDLDGDPLSFSWDFGDNTTGEGAATIHRYAQAGTFTAVVTVSDGRGGSSTASVRIDVGNAPPQPVITAPAADKLFRVGERITLTGAATDPQDGPLPDSSLRWEVLLHHNDHTHPYLPPTVGNDITIVAPPPEDFHATNGSFLEIYLTATDSQGLSATEVLFLQPRKVNITFATNPDGLRMVVNNVAVISTQTVVSWDGYQLNVDAPNQTDSSGLQRNFVSWSDGGSQAHTITTPATGTTYTANFSCGGGIGLTGYYYNNINFTSLRTVRNDATVDFDWGTGKPPGTDINHPNTFSVRWVGKVQAAVTGPHTFTTTSDDGVRLFVGGKRIINNFTNHARTDNSGTINLTAGVLYDIRMEYYEKHDRAVAKLAWSYPGQERQIIPTERLFPHALLVVGNTNLSSGDAAVKQRLECLGYAVTVRAARASIAFDANLKGLVVLSSTSSSRDIRTKFRGTPTPTLTWGNELMGSLGMTSVWAADHGVADGQMQLQIVDASHPLAAGLNGMVTVTGTPSIFSWGNPNSIVAKIFSRPRSGPNATIIATIASDANKAAIFGYEKGAAMFRFRAPARRVGFFLENSTAAGLTEQGLALFDAAVRWVTGR